jgi:NAD(P)-dependent dehydrogenase (short-subunit alcohol dehydrogenase family)
MHELDGKRAIVTGAGAGIGAAVARMLAQRGARVVAADIDAASAAQTAAHIVGAGHEAIAVTTDVTDPDAVDALVRTSIARFGGLDIAVNNAGIPGVMAPIADYPVAMWERVIATNLSSVFFCLRSEVPAMIASGGGAIVNMASVMSVVGFPNIGAYVAAKHGVLGLTRSAAIDHAAQGIRVNAVGPTFILTDLVKSTMDPGAQAALAVAHPIGRLGLADEVAELVAWLVSDSASLVNGSFHPVDGGWTAQ